MAMPLNSLTLHAPCTTCSDAHHAPLKEILRKSVLKRPAHLVARLDASSVSGPALNRCQHDKLPAGGICSNEQAHALDLAIGAYSEVCILPTHEDRT